MQTSCTHDLVVRDRRQGQPRERVVRSATRSSPCASSAAARTSRWTAIPNVSKLKDELANGLRAAPTRATRAPRLPGLAGDPVGHRRSPGRASPSRPASATNQVPAGMNLRILGNEKPAACTAPNHWSQFPNLPTRTTRGSSRSFLTPFGSFSGSGSTTVPVTDFATFYVTGWTAPGQRLRQPLPGQRRRPRPQQRRRLHRRPLHQVHPDRSTRAAAPPRAIVNAFGSLRRRA